MAFDPQPKKVPNPAYEAGVAEGMRRIQAQYVPEPQHYIRLPQQGAQKDVSVGKLSIPFMVAISVMVGGLTLIVPLAWWGGTQVTLLQSSIDRLSEKIATVAIPINERIARIESELSARTLSRYTRTDHELFCAKAERANAKTGWTCGEAFPTGSISSRDTTGDRTSWITNHEWETTASTGSVKK